MLIELPQAGALQCTGGKLQHSHRYPMLQHAWLRYGACLCVVFLLFLADYIARCFLDRAVQGERALSFVLGNQGMIDKTLLFDIGLVRILK